MWVVQAQSFILIKDAPLFLCTAAMFANDRYFLRPRGPNNRVPPKAPAEAPVPPPPPHLPARRKTVWRFRDRPARRINDADNDGIDHEADAVGQSDLSDSEPESEREPGIVRRDNGDGGAGPLTASMFDCPVCYNLLVDPVSERTVEGTCFDDLECRVNQHRAKCEVRP